MFCIRVHHQSLTLHFLRGNKVVFSQPLNANKVRFDLLILFRKAAFIIERNDNIVLLKVEKTNNSRMHFIPFLIEYNFVKFTHLFDPGTCIVTLEITRSICTIMRNLYGCLLCDISSTPNYFTSRGNIPFISSVLCRSTNSQYTIHREHKILVSVRLSFEVTIFSMFFVLKKLMKCPGSTVYYKTYIMTGFHFFNDSFLSNRVSKVCIGNIEYRTFEVNIQNPSRLKE